LRSSARRVLGDETVLLSFAKVVEILSDGEAPLPSPPFGGRGEGENDA